MKYKHLKSDFSFLAKTKEKPQEVSDAAFVRQLTNELPGDPDYIGPANTINLKNKVLSLISGSILTRSGKDLDNISMQKCMHLCHYINIKASDKGNASKSWHRAFIPSKGDKHYIYDDYRNNTKVYEAIREFRDVLDTKVNLLPSMHLVESLISDFIEFMPRTLYDFSHDSIKITTGTHETGVMLANIIQQSQYPGYQEIEVNNDSLDEFAKTILFQEAINHADKFIEECNIQSHYDIELPNHFDYDSIESNYSDIDFNYVINMANKFYNHTPAIDPLELELMVDLLIVIKQHNKTPVLLSGSLDEYERQLKENPALRFAALCIIYSASKHKTRFKSVVAGCPHKSIHVWNELKRMQCQHKKGLTKKEYQIELSKWDYGFVTLLSNLMSGIVASFEYTQKDRPALGDYFFHRAFRWEMIKTMYISLLQFPLDLVKVYLTSICIELDKWKYSCEITTGVRDAYFRSKND